MFIFWQVIQDFIDRYGDIIMGIEIVIGLYCLYLIPKIIIEDRETRKQLRMENQHDDDLPDTEQDQQQGAFKKRSLVTITGQWKKLLIRFLKRIFSRDLRS